MLSERTLFSEYVYSELVAIEISTIPGEMEQAPGDFATVAQRAGQKVDATWGRAHGRRGALLPPSSSARTFYNNSQKKAHEHGPFGTFGR